MMRLFPGIFLKSKFNIRCIPYSRMSDKQSPEVNNDTILSQNVHKPNNFEKTLLVWTGLYKSKDEIPKRISFQAVEKARNKARIKVANYMMLATAIACIFVAISGKRAAERGESVVKMNLDWHRQINEEAKK